MINMINNIPVEVFHWGNQPDHYKIDRPHRHEFAELLFFNQGGGFHEIANLRYEIQDKAIHYIPKSIVHYLERDTASRGFTISFDTDYFEKNNTHKFVNPLGMEAFVIDLKPIKFDPIISQSRNILEQIKKEHDYYRQKCFLLSLELLLNTIASEQSHAHPISQTSSKNDLVRNFKYLVKTNIHKQHSVVWFADQLHVSVKYLSNQVKNNLGISAKQYLLSHLLKSVKRELIDSPKAAKIIAREHSYDESAMGKLFKKHVGTTMKKFRSMQNLEK